MTQPFSFPPPPPPPPRGEYLSGPNVAPPSFAPPYGIGNRGGTHGFTRGPGRGDAFRGRGFSARGRGTAGSYRGDHRNGSFNASLNNCGPRHDSPRNSTYSNLNQQQSLPSSHHGQKRPYSAAFKQPSQQLPRPQAAPAVPSFGGDILPPPVLQLAVPPAAAKKKPRKHNQLGLTPASQDHESSSGEDEEAKLAINHASTADSSVLQFEHKGRTATLQTAADIAAWIAERKKNFPTTAKVEAAKREAEEKKRRWEEAKRDKDETQRLQRMDRDRARQDELRRRALESVSLKKGRKEEVKNQASEETREGNEKAAKPTTKVEKLRRKLEKAQKDARKAEAALAKMQETAAAIKEDGAEEVEASALHAKPKNANTLAIPPAEMDDLAKLKTELLKDDDSDLADTSDTSSNLSLSDLDDDDATNSSGSLSSSIPDSALDSNSDSDSAPNEFTCKRTGPDRVPPPPRIDPSKAAHIASSAQQDNTVRQRHMCRNMLRTGRCHFGDRCRYSHGLPDELSQGARTGQGGRSRGRGEGRGRGEDRNRNGTAATTGTMQRRKGLYQLLVEKEVEEERRAVLGVIIAMGKRGLLGESSSTLTPTPTAASTAPAPGPAPNLQGPS
jgi:Nuclear fragile X mental retardation-interacting protein 1 (NUFIP1)/Zinc finger C-x8-C-x5-C-x3-H type (and similar)